MSEPIKDGGPAFSGYTVNGPAKFPVRVYHPGMTLRDWLAGQALAGSINNKLWNVFPLEKHAEECYRFADAMLAAREDKQ